MTVDELMSSQLVSVGMDDRLGAVLDIFNNTSVHHLLVVEQEKLVGVLSDRDLFRAISPNIGTAAETDKDKATLHKPVHQIMSRHPRSLETGSDVQHAIALLAKQAISCVPIVDQQQQPVGIISWRDIMRLLVKQPPQF